MPAFSARRIASSALCAALVLGVTAPVALATDTARDRTQEAAPVTGAEALRSQVQQLNQLGTMVVPITQLMDAVLKAENGQLPPAEANRLRDAAKAAIARTAATMAAATATTPAAPSAPQASANPASVSLSPAGTTAREPRQALIDLQALVDSLVQAATSGDPNAVVSAVQNLVTGLVKTITDLANQVPQLPTPQLPNLPSVPNSVTPSS